MSPAPASVHRAALAVATALAVRVADWTAAELFMRRSPLWELALALAGNALVLAVLYALAWRCLPRTWLAALLRVVASLLFLILLVGSFGQVGAAAWLKTPWLRAALAVLALAGSLWLARRWPGERIDRLMRALVIGGLAFMAAGPAWRAVQAPSMDWLTPAERAAGQHPPRATLFVLFDETSASASGPMAAAAAGPDMRVSASAIDTVGENTLNVVPELFTGNSFEAARPCGMSSVCSHGRILDFSRVSTRRPGVHVTGLLFPYCDIGGLASCHPLPLPHEFASPWRGLLAGYLRGLRLPVPAWLKAAPAEGSLKQQFAAQLRFIDDSTFWQDGGVMVAHLPVPHPPGLHGMTTLDADYAANIELAATLVRRWSQRLHEQFPGQAALVITSDHPLRSYWCSAESYGTARCDTRSSFRSRQVPWIVATDTALSWSAPTSNRGAFSSLARIADGVLP